MTCVESPSVPVLRAAALSEIAGVRHAFFTRNGGVSTGQYASLNVGYTNGDDPASVAENRRRAMAALGFGKDALRVLRQVHGTAVVDAGKGWPATDPPRADAMVADRPGPVLGILSADCVPVLLADTDAGVIGAAHSGWRGTLAGVVEATVEAMVARGAVRDRIHAAIGPAIGPDTYEVGPEFPGLFAEQNSGTGRFFRPAERTGHYLFDLVGCVAARLGGCGIAVIDPLSADTCGDAARFFSYRRAWNNGEAKYGSGLSAIALIG